jgi:hypothetical protein
MESPETRGPPCAFITCSARAQGQLEPLLAEIERRLLDLGWRTRVPRRVRPGDGLGAAVRRHLRLSSYDDIERADVVLHVPAGRSLQGQSLHRQLHHAVAATVPVLIVHVGEARSRLGIEATSPERLAELASLTGGQVAETLDGLAELLVLRGSTRAG